jgi:hypothetical protein
MIAALGAECSAFLKLVSRKRHPSAPAIYAVRIGAGGTTISTSPVATS